MINNIKEHLKYNKKTGVFIWIKQRSNMNKGDIAGHHRKDGYIEINFNDKPYLAHRLAWFFVYNSWPKGILDHINGIKSDNRIENLRIVSFRENQQNQYKHRKGRLVGSKFNKQTKKWNSQIKINKKQVWLGTFKTEQEAHQKYLDTCKNLTPIDLKEGE